MNIETQAGEQKVDGQSCLLFDPSFGEPGAQWFDPAFWSRAGQAEAADGGRGSAWFIRHEGGHWVLRQFRRGGRIAALSKDRYVYTGLERTRAFREWRLLHELQTRSLPAPAPVAACVLRHGLTYRAQLITVAIPHTQTLARMLADAVIDRSLMSEVGRCVARFHEAGIWHADLNAHNVLIDGAQQVFLIDFDRGERRDGGGWQQGNIDRFERSLHKLSRQGGNDQFAPNLWAAFLAGYHAAN